MKNLIQFTFIAFVSFVFLALSSKKEKDEAFGSSDDVKTSLLWKIEGNELKKPSYLFGTMHMIQKDFFYFPSSLEKIIKKSELIIMELDFNEMNNQAKAMEFMTLKEGTLMDFFDEKQKDTVYAWVKKKMFLNKDAFDANFSKFKPFVLIQTAIQLNFMGKTESYEITINQLAEKFKIKTLGLETMADQMKVFDDLSREDQANMVLEGIRNEEKSMKDLMNMQRIYKTQNLDSLMIIVNSDGGVFAEQETKFLTDRNKKWIPKIEENIKKGQVFIAVGAAHLPGENGVIELLRTKGYTLTPLKN
jgi:uncharacterized protein YbaP (TraB family)